MASGPSSVIYEKLRRNVAQGSSHWAPAAIIGTSRHAAYYAEELEPEASEHMPEERVVLKAVPSTAAPYNLAEKNLWVERDILFDGIM